MRVPRIRLTVGLLMVVVALVALTLGGVRARQHYVRCMKIAEVHESAQGMAEALAGFYEKGVASADEADRKTRESVKERIRNFVNEMHLVPVDQEAAPDAKPLTIKVLPGYDFFKKEADRSRVSLAIARASYEYEGAMRAKYRRAALRFWQAIPPDPPPPDPASASAYWFHSRDYGQALAAVDEAVQPGHVVFSDTENLGAWIRATCPIARYRDGAAAVKAATALCQHSQWSNATFIDTLAAAYAESGDFNRAVKEEQKALALLPASSPDRKAFQQRLKLYQAGEPYRDAPSDP